MNPVATIVIPTHDHGPTLRASVQSALHQTQPVEVFVIGDGVPGETRAIVQELARTDERIRFFDHPKGERHGEAYRHEALQHARGRIVCYLSDDDLYLPHHVDVMSHLLDQADFAHASPVEVRPDGSMFTWTIDLSSPVYQRELLDGRNRIPLSAGAHTLAAYQQLEQGWSPAPPGKPTDLHMWQKFLRHPGFRFRAAETPTMVVFRAETRKHLTTAERLTELQAWSARLGGEQGLCQFNKEVLALKINEAACLDAKIVDAIPHVRMLPPWGSILQVFYPASGGYNETDSACFRIRYKVWQKISVDIPCEQTEFQIRIDPANQPCVIELTRVQLFDATGALLWALRDDSAHALLVGGTAAAVSRGVRTTLISDGEDPQLELPPVTIPADTHHVHLELLVRLDDEVQTLTRLLGEYFRVAAL